MDGQANLRLLPAGRKQYSDAIGMLLHSVTAPSMATSAITVAALKAYILLCLIQKGAILLSCKGKGEMLPAMSHHLPIADTSVEGLNSAEAIEQASVGALPTQGLVLCSTPADAPGAACHLHELLPFGCLLQHAKPGRFRQSIHECTLQQDEQIGVGLA